MIKKRILGFYLFVILFALLLTLNSHAAAIYCGVEAPNGSSVKANSFTITTGLQTCTAIWTINCGSIGWHKAYTWTDDAVQWIIGSTTSDATHYHNYRTTYPSRTNSNAYQCTCINTARNCVQNNDCCTGFCGSNGLCQVKLSDGVACYGSNSTAKEESCSSGLCDQDGIGAADDNWCFTISSTNYDNQDNKCEESANSALDDNADEYRNECRATSGFITDSCVYTTDGDGDSETCLCLTDQTPGDAGKEWNIGGEVADASLCCGNEANEYDIDSSYDSSIDGIPATTDACCDISNNCVHNNNCYPTTTVTINVDSDSDNDYCNGGTWYDCLTDSQCSGNKICSPYGSFDCVSTDGDINIKNMGTTRIENTNQEYTSSRSVMLQLIYLSNATSCRYTNYPNASEAPIHNYTGWSNYESCIGNRIWLLTNMTGLKTVFYQVNYTSYAKTVNDTITYQFNGSGLDTTPPTAPIVYHANYTNINKSALIYWYNVSDPESTVLGIPLVYDVTLYTSTGTTLDTIQTTANFYNFSGFNLAHNTILYANVTVINSANQKVNVTSSALTIDLQKPTINLLQGSLFNISKQSYLSLSGFNENIWVYATNTNFTWNATDAVSNQIVAYSYLLTTNLNQNPDNIPEGTIGTLHNTKTKSYSSLNSDKYYFFVIAKDLAGNWADLFSINFSIDNTPSSKPTILTETKAATSITYTWSQATDDESNVTMYRINLTDNENNPISHFNQTDTSNRTHTFSGLSTLNYNATVGALNGAGIWRWSNQEGIITDFDPPTIKATPNRTVVTLTPILRAWTNEQAVCYYNNSGSNVAFKYTNTTYHETKLNTLTNAHYKYTITCIDTSLNSGDLQINFTIDNSLSASTINGTNSFTTYENIIDSFTINIEDNSKNITGITLSNFNFYIDDNNYDFSIFDIGNSNYNISFRTPDTGTYTLKLTFGGIEKIVPLTVSELYLNAIYEDSNFLEQPDTSKHITYFTHSNRIGFATNDNINLNQINQNNQTLNISNVKLDKIIFIFNTKISNSFLDRENRISNNNFISNINPSFGYLISDNYIVNYILRYDNYLIQSNINSNLKIGKHRLLAISSSKNKIITFSKLS